MRTIPGFHTPSCGNLGPRFQVSELMPPSCILNFALDWLKITSIYLGFSLAYPWKFATFHFFLNEILFHP